MSFKKFFFLLISMMFMSGILFSQKVDKKLNKIMKHSNELIRKKQYDKADKYLRYSIIKVEQKDVIWNKLGQLAADRKLFSIAAEYYKMAMNFKPENRQLYELIVTKYLILSEQYLDAEYQLMHIIPNSKWSQEKIYHYNQYKAFFANKNMIYSNMHKEVTIENLGDAINSPFHEYFPSMSHDDSTMIFTRRFNGVDEDFFIVHKDTCNEQWYSAEHMGYPPNSSKNEGAQCLSYDRNYIYLMRCENAAQSYREAGGCDLYMSFTRNGEWVAPIAFGATINTNYYEGMPTFSSENKTLYFVSDRPGGYGGKDIWKTEYTEYGWTVPVNLGPEINTSKDEISPFIAADNQTLYFSSNGHVGFGGFDVFVARMNDKNEFTQVSNLGTPYNTSYDEISWFLLADGNKAYFASDRPDGYGGMDIYSANVLERYKPQLTTFLSGVVVDSITQEAIVNALIEVYDARDTLILSLKSNSGDGSFFLSLKPYQNYKIIARRFDYPESIIHYTPEIIAHHPPIEFNIELLNWKEKKKQLIDSTQVEVLQDSLNTEIRPSFDEDVKMDIIIQVE